MLASFMFGGALGFIIVAVGINFMHEDPRVFALSLALLAIAASILAVGVR